MQRLYYWHLAQPAGRIEQDCSVNTDLLDQRLTLCLRGGKPAVFCWTIVALDPC